MSSLESVLKNDLETGRQKVKQIEDILAETKLNIWFLMDMVNDVKIQTGSQ